MEQWEMRVMCAIKPSTYMNFGAGQWELIWECAAGVCVWTCVVVGDAKENEMR